MKKTTRVRHVLMSTMFLALFLFGCSSAVQPGGSLDKKVLSGEKSPQRGLIFKNVI